MGGENCNRATAKVGTHGFTAGMCAPRDGRPTKPWQTFSVGIFQWVADALEKLAEGVNPPDHESVAQSALYCYRVMSDLYEKVGR